jgi:hypothetical protein
MLAFFLLAAQQIPIEIVVRVDVRDDPCDLALRIPAALEQTLPGVSIVRATGGPQEARAGRLNVLAVAHNERVHFDVTDENERSVLARDVAHQSDACAATADGVAVIIERYLRDLGYEPPPLPPTVTTTVAGSTTSAAAIEPIRSAVVTERREASEREYAVDLFGFFAWEQGLSGSTSSRFGGAVGGRFTRSIFEAVGIGGVSFGGLTTRCDFGCPQGAPREGTIGLDEYALLGGGGIRLLEARPFHAWVGALFGAEAFHARSAGPSLFDPKDTWRGPRFAMAFYPRLDFDFGWIALFLQAMFWVRPAPDTFGVGGASPPYIVSNLAVTFSLGIRVRIF